MGIYKSAYPPWRLFFLLTQIVNPAIFFGTIFVVQSIVTKNKMERNHIQRLSLGICKPEAGTEYISLAQNSERVADHLINVAKTIRQLQ